jgi:hypothetical protein
MRRLRKLSSCFWVITASSALVSTAAAQAPKAGGSSAKGISKPSVGQGRVSQNQLSDEECRAYAEAVVNAIDSGNRAAFTAQIDWDSLLDTVMVNMDLTDKQRQELKTGLKSGIDSDTGLTGQLVKNSQQGGKVDFLRTRPNHGRQVILFRMIRPLQAGGVGYFEFVPERSAGGKIRAVDLYVFSSGEFISTTLRHALLPVVADQSRSILSKLVTGERAYVKDFPKLSNVTALINEGKMQEALAVIKGMQPETQKLKIILLNRLRAAQSSDEKEYSAVLDDFRNLYPKDPCLDLLLIDYYTLKKDFPKALETIDRLDKSIEGDPYLNIIRAGVSEMRGDLTEAARSAGRAMEQEPTLVPAYFSAVGISMKAGKYDETLSLLKALDQKFHTQFNDLKTVPQYAGFVKSPQYPQWLEYLAQKENPQQVKKSQSKPAVGKNRMRAPKAKSKN